MMIIRGGRDDQRVKYWVNQILKTNSKKDLELISALEITEIRRKKLSLTTMVKQH
jgi:hypothetical protein